MFRPNRPSSGAHVLVVKDSAAHCKGVLFLLCVYPGLFLVMLLNHKTVG
jgi:hypothetical protein